MHRTDAKGGGGDEMSYEFSQLQQSCFRWEVCRAETPERIRYTNQFDNPCLPGEMTTTVTMKKGTVGTELNVVQEGIPSAIPAKTCYLGWQESLT